MPNDALTCYLRKEGGPILSWDVRFRIAIGTTKGIAYLHEECRDCIIHYDIKPENILLDTDFTAKVSDFGLAKLMGRDFMRSSSFGADTDYHDSMMAGQVYVVQADTGGE
ncbi:hypothetical protein K1719_019549 [Acacia pycnantha]|nr:hypothetical protein K1719_019549 [Acacia pycnantha]